MKFIYNYVFHLVKKEFPGKGEIEWICVQIVFSMQRLVVSCFFFFFKFHPVFLRRFLQIDSCF